MRNQRLGQWYYLWFYQVLRQTCICVPELHARHYHHHHPHHCYLTIIIIAVDDAEDCIQGLVRTRQDSTTELRF